MKRTRSVIQGNMYGVVRYSFSIILLVAILHLLFFVFIQHRSDSQVDEEKTAICLTGGARKFELTGLSIVKNILEVYPKADVFLNCPLDVNTFKLSLLKRAPRVTGVNIFVQALIPETEVHARVVDGYLSPNGSQGILQYYNLVEGCLNMIQAHQAKLHFTYDWILRTRVDGFWNGPLSRESFLKGSYVIPEGSDFGGINDRLGIGDYNFSISALSRLSIIRDLDAAGFRRLKSEPQMQAQLSFRNIPVTKKRFPFCILSTRTFAYPLGWWGVPVASISSPGPLGGAYCRPCTPACVDECVEREMTKVSRADGWTMWENGTLQLCDANTDWENHWENKFDQVAGKTAALERIRVSNLSVKECVADFENMKRRAASWETPPLEDICRLGIEHH